MTSDIKPTVSFDDTLGRLDIRLGRIVSVEDASDAPKASYVLTIDFGKYGQRRSVGRFTRHSREELVGKQVLGVLNFEPRVIGNVVSDVLVLGVQYRGADSGEATYLTPATEAKLGSKVF